MAFWSVYETDRDMDDSCFDLYPACPYCGAAYNDMCKPGCDAPDDEAAWDGLR